VPLRRVKLQSKYIAGCKSYTGAEKECTEEIRASSLTFLVIYISHTEITQYNFAAGKWKKFGARSPLSYSSAARKKAAKFFTLAASKSQTVFLSIRTFVCERNRVSKVGGNTNRERLYFHTAIHT